MKLKSLVIDTNIYYNDECQSNNSGEIPQMEEKILRSMAVKSTALMILVVIITIVVTNYDNIMIYADGAQSDTDVSSFTEQGNKRLLAKIGEQIVPDKSLNAHVVYNQEDMKHLLGSSYIVVAKQTELPVLVSMEDMYMKKAICIRISGLPDKRISYESVSRNKQGVKYSGIPVPDGSELDPVRDIDIQYLYNTDNFTYTAEIEVSLDQVYIQHIYEDKDNVYVDLRNPHDEYDKVIVVDAGHGGTDIGTYTTDMQYFEKDFNLSVLLYLKEMLDSEAIKVYYTRSADDKVYLNPRVNLANDLKADLFVSIHCNGNKDASAFGVEALYNEKAPQKGMSSKALSEICLNELEKATGLRNRGLKPRSDIYIIRNAKVPVTLLELGFVTNQSDLRYLLDEENRQKLAKGVYNGIMAALKENDGGRND